MLKDWPITTHGLLPWVGSFYNGSFPGTLPGLSVCMLSMLGFGLGDSSTDLQDLQSSTDTVHPSRRSLPAPVLEAHSIVGLKVLWPLDQTADLQKTHRTGETVTGHHRASTSHMQMKGRYRQTFLQ